MIPVFDPDFAGPADYAALYRGMGLQLVPAWMPSEHKSWKRPHIRSWTDFQKEFTGVAVWSSWYGPSGIYVTRPNMGVITGRVSGNVGVLDLDIHKHPGALAWWRGLLAVHNSDLELETVEQRTGGGGLQKLFRFPDGYRIPTFRTDAGIDCRGEGGFAMLAPSLHESGASYDWLAGFAPWEVEIAAAPDWLMVALDGLSRAGMGQSGNGGDNSPFRQAVNIASTASTTATTANVGMTSYDGFGHRFEGREQYMRDLIWAAMVGLRLENPIGRPPREAMEAVWQDYTRHAVPKQPLSGETVEQGLEREDRGRRLFEQKWDYAAAQWDNEIAQAAEERKAREADPAAGFEQATDRAQQQAKADPSKLFEYFDVDQIMAMPDPVWLIDEMIMEQSLGFIYGPPGSIKTFLALDIALSITARQSSWWGRDIRHNGTVIYLCREGVKSLKFRIQAWEQHRKVQARGTPFYLIQQNINFMSGEDVGRLLATVEDIVAKSGQPVTAVFVDTVSRVLPGAEENQQKDMTLFVGACDAVRQRFNCTVFGVHHTNAVGKFRGSTVMPGAGDFMFETRREPGAMTGSIFAFKVKDGEDGWEQHFKITKVALGEFGTQTSLVIDPVAATDAASSWPDRNMQQRILYAITEAWALGKPWSSSPQSGDRYAPRVMAFKFQIPAKIGKDVIQKWLIDGTLVNEIYNAKKKISGLKVVVDAAPQ